MARLSLYRFRFSLLALSKISTRKLLAAINLGIFISIFAVSAAIISIYFENKIDKIEKRITEKETYYVVYNNWLNRAPKIINEINTILDTKERIENYTPLLKPLVKDAEWRFYGARASIFNFYYELRNLIDINFQVINLSLSDAILVVDADKDVQTIIEKRSEKNKLIKKFDKIYYKQISYKKKEDKNDASWEEYQKYYAGYAGFNKELMSLALSQKNYFLDFLLKYFSSKKKNFQEEVILLQDKIKRLSNLESIFIFSSFIIQFIIFLLVQFFEVSLEQENQRKRKRK